MVYIPLPAILPLPAQLVVILAVPPVLELESSNVKLALLITISIPTPALLVEIQSTQMLAQMQSVIVQHVLTPTVRPVLLIPAVSVFPDSTCQQMAIVLPVQVPTVLLVLTVLLVNAQFAILITLLSMVNASSPPLIQKTLKPEESLPA